MNFKIKIEPTPNLDSTFILPCRACASFWQMLSPSPWLFQLVYLLVLSVVTKYGLNRFFWSYSLIPMPKSWTEISTSTFSLSTCDIDFCYNFLIFWWEFDCIRYEVYNDLFNPHWVYHQKAFFAICLKLKIKIF